jgi:hypothetical protein
MSSDSNAGAWDRVAAELRACREAQQRAWGDLDNATLGRYLAGEVTSDERRRVESALGELPELRKLMNLVGDVLNEFEPTAAPAPVVPEPMVLSLPARPKRRLFRSRLQQWSVLAAAACLLLTLGLLLARTFGPSSSIPSGESVAQVAPKPQPEADSLPGSALGRERESETRFLGTGSPPPTAPLPGPPSQKVISDRELLQLAQVDRSAEDLEKQGRRREAQQLVEHTADEVNRVALRLQQEGDLVQAEPLLLGTHSLCCKRLGPDHPQTQRSRSNLVLTYQVALNAPAQDGTKPDPRAPGSVPALRGQIPLPGENLYGHAKTPAPGHFARAKAEVQKAADTLRLCLYRRSARQLRTTVVPVLTEALKLAASPQDRESLAATLGHLGPAARDAVPLLAECLRKSTDTHEQQVILIALGQMGPSAREAVPALVESLRNRDAETRRCAVEAIVRLGPAARGAVPILNKRAEDKDEVAQEVLRRLEGYECRIGVCDDCDCFSVQALGESLRRIHTLAESSGVEVLVETTPTLAADRKSDDRARELGVRGVYVLMGRDIPAVQVSLSQALQKQGLSADRVRAAVEPRLKDGDFDQALIEGVREVDRFKHTRPDRKSP